MYLRWEYLIEKSNNVKLSTLSWFHLIKETRSRNVAFTISVLKKIYEENFYFITIASAQLESLFPVTPFLFLHCSRMLQCKISVSVLMEVVDSQIGWIDRTKPTPSKIIYSGPIDSSLLLQHSLSKILAIRHELSFWIFSLCNRRSY